MGMRLKKEEEILSADVRKKIIQEIEGSENKRRKSEAYKRWQVFKDKTSTFVTQLLLNQFSEKTVGEMSYAITNISLVKKVVKKLARVYSNGVTRSVNDSEEETENLDELVDILNFDSKMKTSNAILKLQKNGAVYVKPCPFFDKEDNKKFRPNVIPLNPYLYDVVEDFYDRTRPMVYILSNYDPDQLLYSSIDAARVRGFETGAVRSNSSLLHPAGAVSQGDGKDQKIADKKEDENAEQKQYIWWSGKFHFTTNEKGELIDSNGVQLNIDFNNQESFDQILNPVEEIPIVNLAIDQDNSFWAEGGFDLVDSGIVVNSLLTQVNHIAVVQGYGQFFMTGKNLPANIEMGPSIGIKLEYDKDEDPKPEIGFVNASPPLSDLRAQIESLIAMVLTTNDLSTSGVKSQLGAGAAFQSGVAMMIDKAESREDVDDQRQIFIDAERKLWPIISKWLQIFNENNELDDDFKESLLPEELDLSFDFGGLEAISTESERLANLKTRKEMGLNTMAEILMMDNPDLSEKDALKKLEGIEEEKLKRMESFMPQMTAGDDTSKDQPEDEEEDESDKDEPVGSEADE